MQQIADDIYCIPGKVLPGRRCKVDDWECNRYLVMRDPLTLIDTGLPLGLQNLDFKLMEAGVSIREIELILVTHCHPDHSGSASMIKEFSGATIASHPMGARVGQGQYCTGGLHVICNLLEELAYVTGAADYTEPDEFIADRAQLPCGLTAIHAPGHTPDSVCFLDPGSGTLFSGDAIPWLDGDINAGLSGDIYRAQPELAAQSLRMLLSDIDFIRLAMGHFDVVEDAKARIEASPGWAKLQRRYLGS